ncbi:ATP-binding protein [soil metagenome]
MTEPRIAPLDSDAILARFDRLLERVEALLPPPVPEPDWSAPAHRWRERIGLGGARVGWLDAVKRLAPIALDDLHTIDRQKRRIVRNTRQFVERKGANNVLLTGARGTGKSSLIKACLNEFAPKGLRLIEVDKSDLHHLPEIVELVAERPERFIVFCDDLSFEEGEPGYKALKVALDGSVAAQTDNVLIYATSNRRHLLPEYMTDNQSYKVQPDGEIHPGEAVEEKISLSERFGLWISFQPFRQEDYLQVVKHWLHEHGYTATDEPLAPWRPAALQYALERGSRSGRVASQFARDFVARTADDDE